MGMSDRKEVMVVVDMQNDFVRGALAAPDADSLPLKIKERIERFRKYHPYDFQHEVVFTRDTHSYGYLNTHEGKHLPVMHCVAETPGWCVVDELAGLHDHIINKDGFGYSQWEEFFESHHTEPTKIYICGLVTNICVVANAVLLRTLYPGIDIVVIADLCRGTSPESHKAALDVMRSLHIDIEGGDALSENSD